MGVQIAGVGKACPGRNNVIGKVFDTKSFADFQLEQHVTGIKKLFYPSKRAYKELLRKAEETAKKTGIVSRDILFDKDNTVKLPNTYLYTEAMKSALANANMQPKDVEGLIYASDTPDVIFPSNGILGADIFGINIKQYGTCEMACVSFLKAFQDAVDWIDKGYCNNVLIAAGDVNSRLKIPNNIGELFLFGDGFCVVILKKASSGGITASNIAIDSAIAKLFVHIPSYSSELRSLADHERYSSGNDSGLRTLGLCEKFLWPWVLNKFTQSAKIEIDENTKIILPQVTKSVHEGGLETFRKTTKQDIEKNVLLPSSFIHGNTGAGAIPLNLIEAYEAGIIKPHHKIIIVAVGVGGTYAALMLDPNAQEVFNILYLEKDNEKPNLKEIIEKRHKSSGNRTSLSL